MANTQHLRAYIDTRKRDIEKAEKSYDIQRAASLLEELARPLSHPSEFHISWKQIYLDQFYHDVAKFVLSFVTVHILPGFRESQRATAFDVFFLAPDVPPLSAMSALVAQIAATKLQSPEEATRLRDDEAAHVLTQSVRLLERLLQQANAVERIVQHLLLPSSSQQEPATRARALIVCQPAISSLCSVPDLVYNRLQRQTPPFFSPRSFYYRLCTELLDAVSIHREDGKDRKPRDKEPDPRTVIFRMFADKLARIGHMEDLVQAWLCRDDLSTNASTHSQLLGHLPSAAYEPFLRSLASMHSTGGGIEDESVTVSSSPRYLLLSLVPTELTSNKQFQHVIVHKLLLGTKPVSDLLFLRMLVDVLARPTHESEEVQHDDDDDKKFSPAAAPLGTIFDTVVTRWSGDAFPLTADYRLNASIVFFLRYAMTQLDRELFAQRQWTVKLCKGVQSHMAHSVERVRLLGMRVGESVSLIMSPEQPLDFEITESDPLQAYTKITFDFSQKSTLMATVLLSPSSGDAATVAARSTQPVKEIKAKKRKVKGLMALDPDEIVDSEEEDDNEESDSDGDADSDSDSDLSLDAFDLNDDEADLKTPRPVYIKDLLVGLHADDDREKTETALAEAESLLRKLPKDLHFQAQAVVTALLRLEDKYNTPNFVCLRAKALAAACALSPTSAVPYLQAQALEKEQLLQSRVDVLQAMTSAAQELSGTGDFRPVMSKTLLHESSINTTRGDIDSRAMQGLKTRRFGYRRDPLAPAKKNAFSDHALAFFSPLLSGYAKYARELQGSKRLNEVEDVFLAHLLHALASFVECAGHAPSAVPMAKCLMEFAWYYRGNSAASVRRQVLYAFSRVLLVMPPFMLRHELGENVVEMLAWLHEINKKDPDEGCREASRLLLSSGAVPMLSL